MRRSHRLVLLWGLAAGLVALAPTPASAQWYPYPYLYGRWHGGHFPPYWYGAPAYDVGSVRVEAQPRNAQVFVDGYYVGIVDDFDGAFQRLKLPPGGHDIVLHLPGFRNASHRVYVQPRGTFRLLDRLEPLPAGAAPAPRPMPDPNAPPPTNPGVPRSRAYGQQRTYETGTLAIRIEPRDAQVFVDGVRWRGRANDDGLLVLNVRPGKRRVEVRREGYEPFGTEVEIQAGEETPLNVILTAKR